MANTIEPGAPGRIFYGWWIVVGGGILNFYKSGIFSNGFTAFFTPVVQEFKWSATTTSLVFSLQWLGSGIEGPVVGFLFNRVGPRKILLTGTTVMGLGLLLLSRANSVWEFYGAFALVTLGASASGGVTMTATIVNWFMKKRGRVMGIVSAGPALGGLLVPVVVWLIQQYGWRTSLVIVGLGVWIIGIPISAMIRRRPEDYGALPDGEVPGATGRPKQISIREPGAIQGQSLSGEPHTGVKQALRTRVFWLIGVATLMSFFGRSAILVHIMPYLENLGFTREVAGFSVMGLTLMSLGGRLTFGWLGDIHGQRFALALAFTMQTVGIFIFTFIGDLWLLIVFMVVFGIAYGGEIPVRDIIAADYFGRKSYASIEGLMRAVRAIGGMLGPVFAGWIFDTYQDYRLAFLTCVLVTGLAIPAILLAPGPPTSRHRDATWTAP